MYDSAPCLSSLLNDDVEVIQCNLQAINNQMNTVSTPTMNESSNGNDTNSTSQAVDPRSAVLISSAWQSKRETRFLMLFNVPLSISDKILHTIFSSIGAVRSCFFNRRKDYGMVVVSYFSLSDAQEAHSKLAKDQITAVYCIPVYDSLKNSNNNDKAGSRIYEDGVIKVKIYSKHDGKSSSPSKLQETIESQKKYLKSHYSKFGKLKEIEYIENDEEKYFAIEFDDTRHLVKALEKRIDNIVLNDDVNAHGKNQWEIQSTRPKQINSKLMQSIRSFAGFLLSGSSEPQNKASTPSATSPQSTSSKYTPNQPTPNINITNTSSSSTSNRLQKQPLSSPTAMSQPSTSTLAQNNTLDNHPGTNDLQSRSQQQQQYPSSVKEFVPKNANPQTQAPQKPATYGNTQFYQNPAPLPMQNSVPPMVPFMNYPSNFDQAQSSSMFPPNLIFPQYQVQNSSRNMYSLMNPENMIPPSIPPTVDFQQTHQSQFQPQSHFPKFDTFSSEVRQDNLKSVNQGNTKFHEPSSTSMSGNFAEGDDSFQGSSAHGPPSSHKKLNMNHSSGSNGAGSITTSATAAGGQGGSSFNSHDQHSSNEIIIEHVLDGSDRRTSLMIRNIPNKYTQKMLLEEIDQICKGDYDFFYLPIDFKNNCNVGYAFINMIEPEKIKSIFETFDNCRWKRFNSEKICKVNYARIQGKLSLIGKFQNSPLMGREEGHIPLLFYSAGAKRGQREEFPEPGGMSGSFGRS